MGPASLHHLEDVPQEYSRELFVITEVCNELQQHTLCCRHLEYMLLSLVEHHF